VQHARHERERGEGMRMQKGVMFTAEAVYVLVIVFAALIVFLASIKMVEAPNYDALQAMAAMHDAGYAQASPPSDYDYKASGTCTTNAAQLKYYNSSGEVCLK